MNGAGGRSRRPSPVAPDGPARSAASVPHEVVEGCLDCPHPDYCAGMGKCEIGSAKIAARIYELKIAPSMSRQGWHIVKQRIASGSGSWEVVASVFGERRAEIVRDALSEEANEVVE